MLLPVYEFLPLVFALGAVLFYVCAESARSKRIAVARWRWCSSWRSIGEQIPLIGPYRTEAGFVTIIAAMLACRWTR